MKVAIIAAGMSPDQLRLQPYRTLLEMGRQLNALGHVAVFISDGGDNLPRKDEIQDVAIRRISTVRLFRGHENPDLMNVIDEESPDLILWHLGLVSFLHQRLRAPFEAPTIGVVTSPIHQPSDVFRLGPKKLRSNVDLAIIHVLGFLVPGAIIRRAVGESGLRGVITLSERTRQHLVARGVPDGLVWVIPPGVDSEWLESSTDDKGRNCLRGELGYGPDDIVVAYFGSPAPVRGIETILSALELVGTSHGQLRLLILSRRREAERQRQAETLEDRIRNSALRGRIKVVDCFLEQSELIRYIDASDVVCLPFELVPSDVPLSILEAMAIGRGVITTTVASNPELVQNRCGFVIPPASVKALAEQLESIADQPEIALEYGKRARERMWSERTWAQMGQRLQEVLMNYDVA